MSNTVVRGLEAILSGGADFITFEEGKPVTMLFIDWFEDLFGIREHYESALTPKYIRCPGKEICPLCKANPYRYPALRIKFRVYDPIEMKVKFVSLAKSHVQKLNQEFNFDECDPTKNFVTLYRTGKGASDTAYSARRYVANPESGKPVLNFPTQELMDQMPDITPQITPHSPEEIADFMQTVVVGAHTQPNIYNQARHSGKPAYEQKEVPVTQRKLPF
ncbi:hypothetical protein M3629_09180 [Paenibacillus polysaccharolyticus]|uniref:hypothetical protein n=1 Tax=Paenibacillus polysaccharolyticus TaxID=582692 RepID=UPI00203DC2AF|nr:hypothetical protein [Paenibacillus polysaccharolyticus]MCM3132958.1 hypothetical protein [Paenibacillus polysaccharolyticus]